MLVLCFIVHVSMALAAPGSSRTCYNYCHTKEAELIQHAVPLECNCAEFIETDIHYEESSDITLDDTGVYFIPAEAQFVQDQLNSLQPFFISNPLFPNTRHRTNREFDSLNFDALPSQSSHIEIHKKTETISHTTIDKAPVGLPLYLDLEIQESTDKDRSAEQKYTMVEDIEATEKSLVKCLDYQVIHYTRKYGFVKEFQEFWEVRTLDKYNYLSDLDVEENIRRWCSEPASIVQQSLHEIKQGLPKKMIDTRSAIRVKANSNNNNIENKVKVIAESQPQYTAFPLPHTGLNENVTDFPEIITNTDVSNYVTTTFDTKNWVPISTTQTQTILNDDNSNNILNLKSTTEPLTETTVTVTEALTGDNLDKTKTTGFEATTAITPENDLDPMGSEDVFHTNVPTLSKSTTVYALTVPLSTEQSLRTETSNDENIYLYDPQISVTDSNSESRHAYEENDIKIPKMITRECRNNTVHTFLDGIEKLPNNDFRENESDLTGRLYLISNKELVPMRFIQPNGGAISLGIDGPELCDKLINKANKKSSLLTALCKYIKRDLDQNKNP